METNQKTTGKKEPQKNEFDPYAPHKIKWWGWPLLLLLIIGVVYIIKSRDGEMTKTTGAEAWKKYEIQKAEGSVFGTFYHITYQSPSNLQESIKDVLRQVDFSLSPFNEASTITAINNNTCMKADSMFTEVFRLAKEVSAETDGAFDITVAPLVNLWGFGFKNMENVNKEMVDSILLWAGFDHVTLDNGVVIKQHPQTMLDCSAIAKGYGVDAIGKFFESQGIENYMVEIGGEVRVRGTNPKGALWRIGITKPSESSAGMDNEIEQVLQVTHISMATSGNYRNFYEKDGKKYAHTIDPRIGHPVQHSILSSTVFAQDCAVADAYATAFMVLGIDGAKQVLNNHPELMAFFIYTDRMGNMKTWYTEDLNKMFID